MTHDVQRDDDFVVNAKNQVKSDGVAFNVLKYSVGGDDTNQGEKTTADLGDRKKAMEDQYFQDAERSIKLKSRMDKLLAQWIAGLIGRDDVAGYGAEITDARFKGLETLEFSRKLFRIFKQLVRTSASRTWQQR
ncbi:ATPase inhibitor subunit zeta [Rhizobium leguminosarum]|uniref:ATPase inhibitor subunit zeta n=1 Tax=Rhizobium leguminosarum TaxID=384 RepID=UPI001FDF0E42|nr:ATPase inhibitor subunit zeta [Rhizobium leguminosarum]